jgi:hypothetical protein
MELRGWVLEHVFPIAFEFLAWVHCYRKELEERGFARFRILPLSDPKAPLTFEVNWLRCEFLAQVVGMWQLDQWDEQWFGEYRLSQSKT